MSEPDQPAWLAGWTPSVESRSTPIAAAAIEGLAALLDAPAGSAEEQQPLPLLWHWATLAEWPAAHTLGPDGHPRVGGFMPATPYPRRMWLGTQLDVARTPTIGERIDTERTVVEVTEKAGKQGTFALVTAELTLHASTTGDRLLTERTQYAYRDAPPKGSPGESTPPPVEREPALVRQASGEWSFAPNSTMLMAFSAATANTHRIHYDAPYAREVEGYPNLLVHGPLMAVILAEVVRRERPDAVLRTFSCRAQRPMYLGMQATVRLDEPTPGTINVTLDGHDGAHMSATATEA